MRTLFRVLVLFIACLIAGLTIWQIASRRHQPIPRVVISDKTPSAIGKFEFLNGEMLVLIDATSDKKVGDFPSVIMVGDVIEVTSKKYFFAVSPTRKQAEQKFAVYPPGAKIKIRDNGEYTVLVFDDIKARVPRLNGKTYFAKVDEKGLEKTLSEIKKRLNSLPIEAT